MRRLDEIFNSRGADSVAGEDLKLEINGAVEWKGVSFSYLAHNGDGHNGKIPYALKNINVKVGAGEKLAIVGRTGSGKSTMVKLLARLLQPTEGRILLDGRDVEDMPLGCAAAHGRNGAAGADAVHRHARAQHRIRQDRRVAR